MLDGKPKPSLAHLEQHGSLGGIMFMSKRRKSILEGLPMLILLGLLAGAIGGVGIGLIESRTAGSSSSTTSSTSK